MHLTYHPKKRIDHHYIDGIFHFLKDNAVLCIATLLAIVTSIIVPPDAKYLGYFDFKTLTCLFCVLAVVNALKGVRFFTVLATKIVTVFKNTRSVVLALVYVTFIGSMLIANDMALLTFLPLGYFVLTSTKKERLMAFTFIMQNISANLGGMLTPFGNPQNLYLYTYFNIGNLEFMGIMLIPFILSIALITVCCLFIKNEPLSIEDTQTKLPKAKTIIYLLLFALSIIIVFRVVNYLIGLFIIVTVLLFMDKSALKKVDYGLLLTFVMFFIFAGNTARIPIIEKALSSLMEKSPLLTPVISCQVISNVPSAILLSKFTTNYGALLVGVNIGGVGTLISSLASLITFREYVKHNPDKTLKYVGLFSIFNFAFLIILTSVMLFIL